VRLWWVAFNIVIPLAFVAFLAWVVVSRWDDISPVFQHPVQVLVAIAVLILIGFAATAWEFQLLYRAQGLRISLWESWMVFSTGQAGNLLPAQLGTVYRFRYMKAVHALSYTRNGSNAGANLVISVASAAIVGIIGVLGRGITTGSISWVMLAIFAAMAIGAGVAMTMPLPKARFLRGTAQRFWVGFHEGWEELRRQPRTALAVLAIDVGKYAFTALRFQLAFGLVGVEENYWFFVVIAPVAGIAGILSFTPGGLGLREGFLTLTAVTLGTTAVDGLLGATVDRGVLLLCVVGMGLLGYAWTWPRLRRASARTPVEDDAPDDDDAQGPADPGEPESTDAPDEPEGGGDAVAPRSDRTSADSDAANTASS
jgi:uncharacterized membrane protein YbhN (UPF0104 family)